MKLNKSLGYRAKMSKGAEKVTKAARKTEWRKKYKQGRGK